MCFSQIVGGVAGLAGRQAHNNQVQYEAESRYYNADMQDHYADEVDKASQIASDKILERAHRVNSTQVAVQAGYGMSVTSASAMAVRDQTDNQARSDAMATLYSGLNKSSQLRSGAAAGREGALHFVEGNYLTYAGAIMQGMAGSGQIHYDMGGSNTSGGGSTGTAGGGSLGGTPSQATGNYEYAQNNDFFN